LCSPRLSVVENAAARHLRKRLLQLCRPPIVTAEKTGLTAGAIFVNTKRHALFARHKKPVRVRVVRPVAQAGLSAAAAAGAVVPPGVGRMYYATASVVVAWLGFYLW